jgi:WD40 repeat protein
MTGNLTQRRKDAKKTKGLWFFVFLCVFAPLRESVAAPPITAAAFAPDGKQVVIGSQAGIEVRSWPELAVTGRLKTDLSHVHDLAFAPDGRSLLAAGGSPGASGAVEHLNWPDGKRIRRVEDHKDLAYRVAWAPDGSRWASASADHTCRVHAADTGKVVAKYEGHSRPVLAVGFLPDGKAVVSAGVDQSLQVWRADTGEHVRTLDNHVATVNDLTVRPGAPADAPPIVASVGDDRTVRLWQPTIGRLMRFTRLPTKATAAAWSPGGDRLLVGGTDGRLRILDPDTLEVVTEQVGVDGPVYALAATATDVLVGGAGLRRLSGK